MRQTTEHLKPIDLHVHSTCSDGTMTPTELVDYAIKKELAAFALTDHDTVDGLDEAIQYAENLRDLQSCGQETDCHSGETAKACPATQVPEVIPGIELSTKYHGRDIHVLGLYIDYKNEDFQSKLLEFVDSRTVRNRKMCALLQQAGIPVTYEELQAAYPDSVITRAHFGRYLLENGYVKSRQEAFDRYVGDRASCYVPREKITSAQAVDLILLSGGIPVLAHPILYHMSEERLDILIAELKEAGLMGIETIYSTYTVADERLIRGLAAKHGLLLSGGSDFHGANKPSIDLGVGRGKLFVPQNLLWEMKKKLKIK